MKKVIFVIISILFTLNLNACEENSNVGEIKRISYDIESDAITRVVSNGEAKEVARFTVYVDEEDVKNLAYLEFTLYSKAAQTESQFLDFYEALDNFQVIVNGELYDNPFVPINQSAFYIGMYNISSISKDEPVEIILLADVNASYPEIKGGIAVSKLINFSDEKFSEPIAAKHDACLGESCKTAYLIGDTENVTEIAEIEIINDNLGEECSDVEVKLNDGSCVYDQCGIEKPYCMHGQCQMDLDTGAVGCLCEAGYTNPNGAYSICNIRLARFDIERNAENYYTNNGENKLLAEWSLFINDAEDAFLDSIFFHLEGDVEAFSNFQFTIEKDNMEMPFGNTIDAFQYPSDPSDFYLAFSRLAPDFETTTLNKGTVRKIRLYADVNGESENSLEIKIHSANLGSNKYLVKLDLDTELGIDQYTAVSDEDPTIFPWQAHPMVTIQ